MAWNPKSSLSLVPGAALGPRDDPSSTPAEYDPSTSLYAQPSVEAALANFIEGVGGKDALLTELLIAPELPPSLLTLLQFSFDPRFSDRQFGFLCAKAQISPGEVLLAFRDVLMAKVTIQAMHETSKELVRMLREIVRSAITHDETCTECRGTTEVWKVLRNPKQKAESLQKVPCPTCQATGVVIVGPDRESQKMVLDLVGLTRGKASTLVNVGVNTQVSSASGSYSGGGSVTDSPAAAAAGLPQIQQALSAVLFNREAVRPPAIIDTVAVPRTEQDPLPTSPPLSPPAPESSVLP